MMCLPYFLHGLSSPSGEPRCGCDSCNKRLAVLMPPTPPSPPPPPTPPLLLLLWCCCCCCHIGVPLLRVLKKIWCCASQCQPIFPFFDTRFVFFLVIWRIFGDSLIANIFKAMSEWIWHFSSSIELLVELFHSINKKTLKNVAVNTTDGCHINL